MQSAVMFSPLLQLVFLLSFIQLSPVVFTVMVRVNKQEDLLTGWYTFFFGCFVLYIKFYIFVVLNLV